MQRAHSHRGLGSEGQVVIPSPGLMESKDPPKLPTSGRSHELPVDDHRRPIAGHRRMALAEERLSMF